MQYSERHTKEITTDASGDAVAYLPVRTGRVGVIIYNKDGVTPFDDGVDFNVSFEATQQVLWGEENVNASKYVGPRMQVHGNDGIGLVAQVDGAPIIDYYPFADDRIKIVISNGGDTKTGEFIFILV